MIFSAVRSNEKRKIGFLDNPRRINVALSRAKHGLIIIGNKRTLENNKTWRFIIQHFVDYDCYFGNLKAAIKYINEVTGAK